MLLLNNIVHECIFLLPSLICTFRCQPCAIVNQKQTLAKIESLYLRKTDAANLLIDIESVYVCHS